MKKKRLAKVLELINQYEIETQEELQQKLRETGFEVTQATISRDIKELRLVKELSAQGHYKYTASRKVEDMSGRVGSILLDCVVSVDYAVNTVVLKCHSGMANAACAAIDLMEWDGVVGTLAGDDTIFVLCRSEDYAIVFAAEMERMTNA